MISEERLKQAVHEAAEALDRSLPDPEPILEIASAHV